MVTNRSDFPPGIHSIVSGTLTSVLTSTAQAIPNTAGQTCLIITNGDSTNDLWVGDSHVAVGKGTRVPAGQSFPLSALDDCVVYVIGGSGTVSAVGYNVGIS